MTRNAIAIPVGLSSTLTRPGESAWLSPLLIVLGTCLTAAAARVVIPLPFTPVPITGQVLAVLLVAGLLRPRPAATSQVLYVAAGAAGLPWFAGSGGFVGVTAGYIVGFCAAAPLVAGLLDRPAIGRSLLGTMLAMTAGVAVIYTLGAAWFALVMRTGLAATLAAAVAPYVLVDLGKVVLAASIVRAARRSLARPI